jgi:hypothetical protein
MNDVRRRVEAALEIARRTTTLEGERAAALNRAHAMIERHDLDPDDFDIPGRKRSKPKRPPQSAFREDLFARSRSPFWNVRRTTFDDAAIEAIRADLERQLKEAAERMRKQMTDAAYMREVADFVRRQKGENTFGTTTLQRARKAVDFLSAKGWKIYPGDDPQGGKDWLIVHETGVEGADNETVLQMAEERGFDG